jgi:hypothetical protein
MNLRLVDMMVEIKHFDEIVISTIIRQLDLAQPMEYIYFNREIMDRIGVPRKEYLVKFEGEEEETLIYLSDIPFRFEEGYAIYNILFSTTWGRFYAHEKSEINSFKLMTKYIDLADFNLDYDNRPIKEVGKL